ncbi:MAG: HesA/MoeB/ThiF family protein [Candidatus Eutrophobiaceae bacterium]
MMDDGELLRYSRQMMLPEIGAEGQLRLSKARVLVVGLGGLGSSLSLYLASAGVGHLVLADLDTVDLSNLQRQILYGTEDIGSRKTQAALKRLAATNPHVRLTAIDHALEGEELAEQAQCADVVADASDNFRTRFALNDACMVAETPLVSAAAIRFEGQISVFDFRNAQSPCYRCLYNEEYETNETCTENGVFAPLLGIMGSLQANEVLKIIMGIGLNLQGRLLLLDSLHAGFHEAKLARDPACPCGKRQATKTALAAATTKAATTPD